jgi:flavin reductase (DIM6/NTAB) family NADH-FMN oxidoreductase RutF
VSAAGVGPDLFRELLGRFATGVTILTTRDASGRAFGMTANAVASVSLTPPLMLVCVDRTREIHDVLERSPHFAFSVLAHHQEALARRFAETAGDRFDGIATRDGPHGVPLVEGAIAHIACARHAVVPAGDHTVFIGLVEAGAAGPGAPLGYFRGTYHDLGRSHDAHRG